MFLLIIASFGLSLFLNFKENCLKECFAKRIIPEFKKSKLTNGQSKTLIDTNKTTSKMKEMMGNSEEINSLFARKFNKQNEKLGKEKDMNEESNVEDVSELMNKDKITNLDFDETYKREMDMTIGENDLREY